MMFFVCLRLHFFLASSLPRPRRPRSPPQDLKPPLNPPQVAEAASAMFFPMRFLTKEWRSSSHSWRIQGRYWISRRSKRWSWRSWWQRSLVAIRLERQCLKYNIWTFANNYWCFALTFSDPYRQGQCLKYVFLKFCGLHNYFWSFFLQTIKVVRDK